MHTRPPRVPGYRRHSSGQARVTHDGTNDLDASIKDGLHRRSVAIAGARRIRNPIRLARLVMDWCDERGEQTDKGIRLKVLLTHEEIAQMIGTTRETVTRLLTSLRAKKVIEIKGSTVNVMRYEALEQMVTV